MKTYFKFNGTLSSKDIVEAISSPIGIGPFAGFGSGTISDDGTKITIKAGNINDRATVNEKLQSLISDRILARYIPKYEGLEAADINFGCISRDGYIYTNPNGTLELPIQGTKSGLNEVLVFAKHTRVTEPVDNPVEFEAYWNQSTICFYDLFKKSLDPYYPTPVNQREINFINNDPLVKVVDDSDNRKIFSYEYLIAQVAQAVNNYSSENMVLVGIYGKGSNKLTSTSIIEPFAIVPYGSVWPTQVPYNTAIHGSLSESLKRIEAILSDWDSNNSIKRYVENTLTKFKEDINKTVALASLPQGSILLWDSSNIPDGWEEVTAAQGKILMGYLEGGITVKGSKVLTSLGATYTPASSQEYDFTIDASNLPRHAHAMGVTLSESQVNVTEGTIKLPMIQSYGNRNNALNGSVGGDNNTTIEVQQGAIVTSYNLTAAGSFNTQSNKDNLQIEKLPPTITMKFIRKVK